MKDIFRPQDEKARYIYDTFQRAAQHREGKSHEEWQQYEREKVVLAALEIAKMYGLRSPTMEQVKQCETQAEGHADYGAKWARGILDVMEGRQ